MFSADFKSKSFVFIVDSNKNKMAILQRVIIINPDKIKNNFKNFAAFTDRFFYSLEKLSVFEAIIFNQPTSL